MTVDRDDIQSAYRAIWQRVRKTPLLDVDLADFGGPSQPLTLKLELLQHSGSFKARGAFTNLLLRDIGDAGVCAASGGNHGAAVAYAAAAEGVDAKIFVPSVASPAKVAAIRALGADLVVVGDGYDAANEAAHAWVAESGATNIHAFEQAETMMGQGTVGLELAAQMADVDTLLVAVGGGGLIGGIAAWFEDRVRIIGVEPETAPTLRHALDAGEPVDAPAGGVAADSLAPRRVGSLMYPIAESFVDDVVLVTDAAIVETQRVLWRMARLAAEPGGAAALAAILDGRYRPEPDERVCVLVCGGNLAELPV